jgi:hypothetical protein
MSWASGNVALRPTQGMLKTQPRLGSDGHGQLVERNRHTPIRRLLNGQLVVSAPNVLDERMPGDDDSGATVWVPESASWVLSCGFVGEAIGPR